MGGSQNLTYPPGNLNHAPASLLQLPRITTRISGKEKAADGLQTKNGLARVQPERRSVGMITPELGARY